MSGPIKKIRQVQMIEFTDGSAVLSWSGFPETGSKITEDHVAFLYAALDYSKRAMGN